jgi:ParB/RepB/Spo0J family partition protein
MRTERQPKAGTLGELNVALVRRNEHNPRLIFRADELEELAKSIEDIGVQVPISVYREGRHYVLLDGERRVRACRMLNMKKIPAIVYPKPDPVKNIVFMFNIHRFRKDWDPLPTAMKLDELKDLIIEREGRSPSEADLAALTGMSRGAIRRCKLIMEIPEVDRRQILQELEKAEYERRITTDLFVEAQRSVRTISTYLPEEKALEEPLRRALITKYKNKVIDNVVDMRLVAKIARSVKKGIPKHTVVKALNSIINEPKTTLDDAYATIAWIYDIRTVNTQARSLAELVNNLDDVQAQIDAETWTILDALHRRLGSLLKGRWK